jgi:hypothetical protein
MNVFLEMLVSWAPAMPDAPKAIRASEDAMAAFRSIIDMIFSLSLEY